MWHSGKEFYLRESPYSTRIQPSDDEGSNENNDEPSNEDSSKNAEDNDQVPEEDNDALKENNVEDIPLRRSRRLRERALKLMLFSNQVWGS